MLDTSLAYNKYKFLGNEFLTWLWFSISNQKLNQEIEVGAKIIVETQTGEDLEKLVITGDKATFGEALLALKKGGLVTEMQIVYYNNANQRFTFMLKGESLNFAGLKLPETAINQSYETKQQMGTNPEDEANVEAKLLDRMDLIESIAMLLEDLYGQFIKLRISNYWTQTVLEMQEWSSANC